MLVVACGCELYVVRCCLLLVGVVRCCLFVCWCWRCVFSLSRSLFDVLLLLCVVVCRCFISFVYFLR